MALQRHLFDRCVVSLAPHFVYDVYGCQVYGASANNE